MVHNELLDDICPHILWRVNGGCRLLVGLLLLTGVGMTSRRVSLRSIVEGLLDGLLSEDTLLNFFQSGIDETGIALFKAAMDTRESIRVQTT